LIMRPPDKDQSRQQFLTELCKVDFCRTGKKDHII